MQKFVQVKGANLFKIKLLLLKMPLLDLLFCILELCTLPLENGEMKKFLDTLVHRKK